MSPDRLKIAIAYNRTDLMSAIGWLTFGTTFGVVSPWIIWRWKRRAAMKPENSRSEAQAQEKTTYASVSVRTGLIACDSVSKICGQRFLESEAPQIPLPTCKESKCQCRLQYHSDRRSGEDRRNSFANTLSAFEDGLHENERSKSDRRKSKKLAPPRAYFNDHSR
jgi:hypothetical protein